MKYVKILPDGRFKLLRSGKPKTTPDGKTVIYSGHAVFELKDTHGMPFSVIFMKLTEGDDPAIVAWIELIEAARAHGWWDYQTYDAIKEGFADSGAWPDKQDEILARIRAWIVLNPISHLTDPKEWRR